MSGMVGWKYLFRAQLYDDDDDDDDDDVDEDDDDDGWSAHFQKMARSSSLKMLQQI